jgi:hypothetical protein
MQNPQVDPRVTSPEETTFEGVLPGPTMRARLGVQPVGSRGVALQRLPAGTVLTLKTQHSRYRLEVLDGVEGRVLITGGAVFTNSTEVRVGGATSGGDTLRAGWIGEGLRLELLTAEGRVMTSRVESVTVGDDSSESASI